MSSIKGSTMGKQDPTLAAGACQEGARSHELRTGH